MASWNLDYSSNKLDLITPINIYKSLTDIRTQQEDRKKEKDKQAKIERLRQSYTKTDSKTGQKYLDEEGYAQAYTTEVNTQEGMKMQAGLNQRKIQKENLSQLERKKSFERNQALGQFSRTVTEAPPEKRAEVYESGLRALAGKDIIPEKWLHETEFTPQIEREISFRARNSLSPEEQRMRAPKQKDIVDARNKAKMDLLSEEFRTQVLPNLDISGAGSDPEKRNQLVKKIQSSKYWKSPLAKEVIKEIKTKGPGIAGQIVDALTKKELVKERFKIREEERKAKAKLDEWSRKKAEGGAYKSTQYVSANYGNRMLSSVNQMDDLYDKGYKREEKTQKAYDFLPKMLTTEQRLLQDQSERNFVNANLRRESGAAIADSEFSSAEAQYFPRPGDGAEVLEQKRINRAMAIAAMKAEAGGAWEEVQEEFEALYKPKRIGKYIVVED